MPIYEDNRFHRNMENGLYYPRTTWITSVLPKPGLAKYRESLGSEEADRIMMEAADSGSEIHRLAEIYFGGGEIQLAGLEKSKAQKIIGLQQFDEDFRPDVIFTEKRFYKDLFTNGGWSGTIDFIGRLNKKPGHFRGGDINPDEVWVIDYKTGASLWREHEAQITGYSEGIVDDLVSLGHLAPHGRVRRGLLHLRPGSSRHYTLKEITNEDFSDLDWYTLLNFFFLVNKNMEPKIWETPSSIRRQDASAGNSSNTLPTT